jgi:hypothetical protein
MIKIRNLCFLVISLLCTLTIGGCAEQKKNNMKETTVKEIDLSQYKDTKPEGIMKLLFIHHSCGGQWLADKGEAKDILPGTCIYESHPNGGGLRNLLQQNNYEVHEASYKSGIGDKTDVCDWNVKFRDRMGDILRCDRQDTFYKDTVVMNDIVMFKSCFPANAIDSEGKEPGDPDSTVQTTANYKAAYSKLLGYFRAHPNTLFVCVTAPPLVKSYPNRLKEIAKRIVAPEKTVEAIGDRARKFNNWLKDKESGWLAGYEGKNIVVFDYYDVLTKHGESNHALYPTNGGNDSHPSTEGNTIAAKKFIPFLNRAVNRFAATH